MALLVWLCASLSASACAIRAGAAPPTVESLGVAHAAATPTATPQPTPLIPTRPQAWNPTPRASVTDSATATHMARPSATPAPGAATATPCTEKRGQVSQISVPSHTLRYEVDARLYLPPCYATSGERYPVLYLIHGLGFTEDQWQRLGATEAADRLIGAGEIAPLVIVMPRDRRDSRWDPAFVKDLVPYIDQRYRTLGDREHRAIGGLSRGGGWAVHLGLRYSDQFGRIGAHSPAVFLGDENSLLEWTHHLPLDQIPAIYVDIGEGDRQLNSARWLDQVFTWFKVEHTYLVQPGGHSEKYWTAHMGDYLRFYAADWREPPQATSTPRATEATFGN